MNSTGRTNGESGWVVYSIYLFLILGSVNIIHGVAMLANSEWVAFTPEGAWLLNITGWGWVTLILGLLQVLVGWGLTKHHEWARVSGITLAMIGSLVAVINMPIYAMAGVVALGLSLAVLYGLSAHPFTE